jgi:dethiobiotin synthetase
VTSKVGSSPVPTPASARQRSPAHWCARCARGAVRVAVAKPVASGAKRTAQGLRNDDALELAVAANLAVTATHDYQRINPFCFEPPIAPHIAAAEAGVTIDVAALAARIRANAAENDWLVVEGAGGWRVPLDATRDFSDLAIALDLPIVLVVGLRLGCINHALLSAESIAASGLKLTGWIANGIDPAMARATENIATLTARLGAAPSMVVPARRHVGGNHIARRAGDRPSDGWFFRSAGRLSC